MLTPSSSTFLEVEIYIYFLSTPYFGKQLSLGCKNKPLKKNCYFIEKIRSLFLFVFCDHTNDNFKVLFTFPKFYINYIHFHLKNIEIYDSRWIIHLNKRNALKTVLEKWCGIYEYWINLRICQNLKKLLVHKYPVNPKKIT